MEKDVGKNKLQIKRADAVVIIVCLLSALILAVGLIGGREKGKILRISHDGTTVMTVALEEDIAVGRQGADASSQGIYYLVTYEEDKAVIMQHEKRPDLPSGVSYNLLYISANEVQMVAADCRDQICVHHRPITGSGENIICLPHRLVAELTGGEQDGMTDGMVK